MDSASVSTPQRSLWSLPVLIAALGYFVDVYDLLLFAIVRVPSLRELGLTDVALREEGMGILNGQMIGLLLGGILWGVLGDKKGRLSVLFGSILLYSLANIANGFVTSAPQYLWCRFIAGIGLAGELGAGITLVSELLPKHKRGLATSLVAGFGLTGAVAAYFIAKQFHWTTCYFIGGGAGLLLLLMRVSVFESGMFHAIKETAVSRGNFFQFFTRWHRFRRYLLCILIGLPTWFVIGILVTFSKEYGEQMGLSGPVEPSRAVLFAYIGIALGDVASGFLSNVLRSRKKALFVFYSLTTVFLVLWLGQRGGRPETLYWLSGLLGFGCGFWAIFVTVAAESFGTNLRATAATTIPNMVRGTLPLFTAYMALLEPRLGLLNAASVVAASTMVITFIAAALLDETYGRDLAFTETDRP
ncbi:MAG: MFS transporter [Sphingobacteriales bacterium]|nr:MAG: MFS transporter [Sphingobacteriales bacterium]